MFRVYIAFFGIALGFNMTIFMQTYVATALPTIAEELNGMSLYSWVISVYMLAVTITLPLFGKLGDSLGKKRIFLSGLAVFLIGSLMVGFTETMEQMVFFRLVQGLGAGAMGPSALAALSDMFDGPQKGASFGILGALQILAILAGPSAGGWFTDHWDWRVGFFIMIPLGILSALTVMIGMKSSERKQQRWNEFDWKGAFLFGFATALGLIGTQYLGNGDILIGSIEIVVAVFLLGWTIRMEKKHPDPAVPVGLLSKPLLGRSVLGSFLLGVIQYGAVAYIPLYVQKVFGGTATKSGIVLLPMLLAAGIASGLAGFAIHRLPSKVISSIGWLMAGCGFLGLIGMQDYSNLHLILATILVGICFGLLIPLFLVDGQDSAGKDLRSTTSGMIQMARNLGGAISVPLLVVWLPQTSHLSFRSAMHAIFFSLAAITLFGILTGWHNGDQALKKQETEHA